ncbi:MAG: 3'(2'),5'-bisphosphate nucleotidase CysQ [Gammaproteobacteria bacterium CG11_big_fil_rev_8_21_14_0_20_46_22]|nr:MAG: 3'(2'),5'-bisphosphate nucleotidase CysQ [Gammaproteobacteria bacterium CG11_big_fil_rev_8_21_14_0_20_46_22]
MDYDQYLDIALSAACQAAGAIMAVYHRDIAVEQKADQSPVTQADLAAHDAIVSVLAASGFPVISEESEPDLDLLKRADYHWLVDPLDGTKEFIQKNGEFTVNIALIHHNRPVLSVVAVPAKQVVYYALKGQGAFKVEAGVGKRLQCSSVSNLEEATIAVSRSHLKPEDQDFIEKQGITKVKPLGSALKYCEIAEGLVDCSVRFTPLMQWDLAASDLIVSEAGACAVDFSGNVYSYRFDGVQQALTAGLLVSNGLLSRSLMSGASIFGGI